MEGEAGILAAASGPKRRYTYAEAAEILRVKERWLRDNLRQLPHSKKGVTVTFSEADLDAIDAMFHHQPPGTVHPSEITPASTRSLASIKPKGARRPRT